MFWILAGVSAVWLFLVGMVLSPFYAGQIGQWLGLDPRLAIAVLFVLWGLHLGPLVILGFAATVPDRAVWRGGLWLLYAAAPLWVGVYGLIILGDWGDAVLWGPYLLTGVCLAILGFVQLGIVRTG